MQPKQTLQCKTAQIHQLLFALNDETFLENIQFDLKEEEIPRELLTQHLQRFQGVELDAEPET